jgi:manganese/zinc/iron transport system ATP- binding protein
MDEPFAGVDAASEKAIIGLLNELKSKGKTLLVVHHDLHSAKNYFDWLVLLNTRLVGSGPLEKLYTDELLSETYGGTLTSLSKIATKIEKQGLPIRHK